MRWLLHRKRIVKHHFPLTKHARNALEFRLLTFSILSSQLEFFGLAFEPVGLLLSALLSQVSYCHRARIISVLFIVIA